MSDPDLDQAAWRKLQTDVLASLIEMRARNVVIVGPPRGEDPEHEWVVEDPDVDDELL